MPVESKEGSRMSSANSLSKKDLEAFRQLCNTAPMPRLQGNPEGSPPKSHSFGNFHMDFAAGELRKRGVKLKLSGQPFEILRLLLERSGQVVSREELRSRLWANEAFVDSDHGLNAAINKLRLTLGDSSGRPRFIETVPRRGYRFIAEVRDGAAVLPPVTDRRPRRRVHSLVVLPLENLSGDPSQEYFADGMTEALITDLAKISALRVISRTSAMRYKGTHTSLREIAQELNVDAVVEGSVLRVGERVRITAQLVHASSDAHLWAESYERDLHDVLAIQADVAQAIAAEIRIQISSRERKQLRSIRPVDPQAHESYLLGRHYWNKRTLESLGKALEHFQRAVEIDADFALAHAGIADTYVVLGGAPYERVSPHYAMPKAWAAAEKALQINESLGEAHATLAFINWLYKREWKTAEVGFRRAIQLSPGYSTAYQWYGAYLAHLCRSTQALAIVERARELDPLSMQINTAVVQVLYFGRAYDRAVEQALRTLELDSSFPTAHMMLALIYVQKSMPAEALVEAEKAAVYSGRSPAALAVVGACYAALGKPSEATRVIRELQELSKEKHVSPYLLGWVYACMGDKESALPYFERAYADGSTYLALIKGDPALDSLRADVRFQDLQRRVGFA